jgi:hypothetical protein
LVGSDLATKNPTNYMKRIPRYKEVLEDSLKEYTRFIDDPRKNIKGAYRNKA